MVEIVGGGAFEKNHLNKYTDVQPKHHPGKGFETDI